MPTFQLIQKISPSGTATASFTSIPSTYDDLFITWSGRTSGSITNKWDEGIVTFNSDTTASNYFAGYLALAGNTSSYSLSISGASGATRYMGTNSPNNVLSNTFSSNWMYINKYASSIAKNAVAFGVSGDTTGGEAYQSFLKWGSASAINRIDIATTTGNNYLSGTNFYLYGIKNS